MKLEPFEVTAKGGIVFKYSAPVLVDVGAAAPVATESPPPRSSSTVFPALYRKRTSLDDYEFEKDKAKVKPNLFFAML